jgi:hypothetical protein
MPLYKLLHNYLNVPVQIANEIGLQEQVRYLFVSAVNSLPSRFLAAHKHKKLDVIMKFEEECRLLRCDAVVLVNIDVSEEFIHFHGAKKQ